MKNYHYKQVNNIASQTKKTYLLFNYECDEFILGSPMNKKRLTCTIFNHIITVYIIIIILLDFILKIYKLCLKTYFHSLKKNF